MRARRRAPALALSAAMLLAVPAAAEDEQVYDGMTAEELADFAAGEGWEADIRLGGGVVEMRTDGRPVHIELLDCDADGRCKSGVIRDVTYYFLEPSHSGFWHWNLENRGATGYGPSYVTLQRYLHFVGVTDRYLRDVIGTVWPRAAEAFWAEVEGRAAAERASRDGSAPE
jgi:hypothetical protein